LAPSRSPIAIALAVARLALATLARALTFAALSFAPLIVAPVARATLTVAIAVALIAPALVRTAAPARAAFATLLLLPLSALARGRRRIFGARRCPSFGPRATPPPTAPARAIAYR
jgi:glucose dehydrogenase